MEQSFVRPVHSELQSVVVLADSYSDFIEIDELKGTTAKYIIEFLKEQFGQWPRHT